MVVHIRPLFDKLHTSWPSVARNQRGYSSLKPVAAADKGFLLVHFARLGSLIVMDSKVGYGGSLILGLVGRLVIVAFWTDHHRR